MTLFDEEYYKLIYPEYRQRCPIPLLDYARHGWKNGANPGPFFNTIHYLAQYPDLARRNLSPLEHFALTAPASGNLDAKLFFPHGPWNTLRKVELAHVEDIALYLAAQAGLFNAKFYLETYPDVATEVSPLFHYRSRGWREKRRPSPLLAFEDINAFEGNPLLALFTDRLSGVQLIMELAAGKWRAECIQAGLFDADYYEYTYPLVKQYASDSFLHYMIYGCRLGYNPSPSFNTVWYLRNHPDAADNPLGHCLQRGGGDGFPLVTDFPLLDDSTKKQAVNIAAWEVRRLGWFDEDFYLDAYPDLDDLELPALEHYQKYGIVENRIPSTLFNSEWYLEEYLDNDPAQCAIWHYLTQGRQKGLSPRPNDAIQILQEENRLLFEQIKILQNELKTVMAQSSEARKKLAALQEAAKKAPAQPKDNNWKAKYEVSREILLDMLGKYGAANAGQSA